MAEQCSLQPGLITFHTTMSHMRFLVLDNCMHATLPVYLHSKHPQNLTTYGNLTPPLTEILALLMDPREKVSHLFTQKFQNTAFRAICYIVEQAQNTSTIK